MYIIIIALCTLLITFELLRVCDVCIHYLSIYVSCICARPSVPITNSRSSSDWPDTINVHVTQIFILCSRCSIASEFVVYSIQCTVYSETPYNYGDC